MAGICDLHNHILPGMDDGCATVEESLAVLTEAARQGVYHIIATPHYYPEESLKTFLQRREASENLLRARLPEDFRLCVGAEVAWFDGISGCDNLDALCFGNSRYLLLELPFAPWTSNMFREIRNLNHIRGIVPIIAHLERYLSLQNRKSVEQLLSNDVLVQMNAEYLLNFKTSIVARGLLKRGVVQLLGTDCHNLTSRPFNLGLALKKRGFTKEFTQAARLSMEIFLAAEGKESW